MTFCAAGSSIEVSPRLPLSMTQITGAGDTFGNGTTIGTNRHSNLRWRFGRLCVGVSLERGSRHARAVVRGRPRHHADRYSGHPGIAVSGAHVFPAGMAVGIVAGPRDGMAPTSRLNRGSMSRRGCWVVVRRSTASAPIVAHRTTTTSGRRSARMAGAGPTCCRSSYSSETDADYGEAAANGQSGPVALIQRVTAQAKLTGNRPISRTMARDIFADMGYAMQEGSERRLVRFWRVSSPPSTVDPDNRRASAALKA